MLSIHTSSQLIVVMVFLVALFGTFIFIVLRQRLNRVNGAVRIAYLENAFHEMTVALEEANKKERAIFENVLDVICTIAADGTFVRVSPSCLRVWGYGSEELIGKRDIYFVVRPDVDKTERALAEVLAGKALTDFENRYVRKDGSVVDMLWSAWFSESDRVVFAVARDITARKRGEHYLAYHDSLTGLPNRTLFKDRLALALEAAQHHQQKLAVMFVDLDRFQTINHTLGHAVGDQLLVSVAERLSRCIKAGDTVARITGDGFGLLLTQLDLTTSAERHAFESALVILNALEAPFNFDGQELFITASVGIAFHPDDGGDAPSLLRNAGAALSRMKEQGGNGYQSYAAGMNATSLQRLTLENCLRRALARGEFVLHYQPQVEIRTGRITAVEALLRWRHPDFGLVSPTDFIPLAESTGLIVPIGEWAIRTACAQVKQWQDEGLGPLRMSVNLSARQFEQPDLPETVARLLDETGLEPDCMEFELTESSIMKNAERAVAVLKRFKLMRIQIAIDDFGSGYSSLSHLKRFPIDRLKIDGSFVQEATKNRTDAAIILAIITLAQNLRLKVIAEGVETEAQMRLLRSLKCDEVQGYFCSRPLPGHELRELLLEERAFGPLLPAVTQIIPEVIGVS